jgi:hypothetical protein
MNYTDIELKLIAHALDLGDNREGEAANAAAMFFKQLRKRGITRQQFTSGGGSSSANYESLYNSERYNASMYRMEAAAAKSEIANLKAKLADLTTRYQMGGIASRPYRKARTAATKGELLSDIEWEILKRIATYWEDPTGTSMPTSSVTTNNSERGSLSTMIRKGVIEKPYAGRVKLTEAGLTYYRERIRRAV